MEIPRPKKLLFIYNAESGLRNTIIDGAHKILRPSTYSCNLCSITFGAFAENNVWKKFRKESAIPMEFLHKDEFKKQYASKFGYRFTFPIVLWESPKGLEVLVTTHELNDLGNPESLIGLIEERKYY